MDRRIYLATTAGFLSSLTGCSKLQSFLPSSNNGPEMLSPETKSQRVSLDGSREDDGSWPQVAHDAANTRYATGVNPPEDEARIAWRSPDVRSLYPPVVSDDLYLTERWTEGMAFSLDRWDGRVRWENRSLPSNRWAPAVLDDRMFVLSRAEGNIVKLHALRTDDGREQWVKSDGVTATSNTGPTLADGKLFIATSTGVGAFEADTGDIVWDEQIADHIVGNRKTLWPKPAVRNGQVYTFDTFYHATEGDLPVYALDQESGNSIWKTEVTLQPDWQPRSQYAVTGRENVFVSVGERVGYPAAGDTNRSNTPEEIVAIDTESGSIPWKWRLDRELFPMAYADGYLFVPTWDRETKTAELHVLNIDDGTIAWSYQTDSGRISAPTVTPERVYFSQGPELVGLAVEDGSKSMSVSFKDEINDFPGPETPYLGDPVIANDSIYLLLGTGGQPNQSVVYCVRRPQP